MRGGSGPKDWFPGGRSRETRELEIWLKACVLIGGEGEIDIAMKGPVYIAIVHDGSGFNPAAAIAVDQNQYHDLSNDVLEKAYEVLQDHNMKNEAYVKELQDEWGDRWEEILTEAYDGKVWTFQKAAHAANAILTDKDAKRLIGIEDPAKACEYCGEPENVRLVHFDNRSDPPALMCRSCREEREERAEREGA